MRVMPAPRESDMIQPRWRVGLRFILGQLQMMGAITTGILLFERGVGPAVICGVLLTVGTSLVSLLLFRVVWRHKGEK